MNAYTWKMIYSSHFYFLSLSHLPQFEQRASTSLNMDRRAAMGAFAVAGVAALPQMAFADTRSSMQRARFVYGLKITNLKDAVAAGDFAAVDEGKSAFTLFNSGVYQGSKNKAKESEASAATNAIYSAIRSKDKSALQSAYASYLKTTNIKPEDFSAEVAKGGQGYSSDSDYRVNTKQAVIYVR